MIEHAEVATKILKPLFELFVTVHSENLENIPDKGPLILVSNHRSDLDPWVIAYLFPRYISWIADSYLFALPVIGNFLSEIGAIPISEKKSDYIGAYRKAKSVVQAGHAVGMFPEGHETITHNKQHLDLGEFRAGFAEYALKFRVPILPVTVLANKEKFDPIIIPPFIKNLIRLPQDVRETDRRLVYEEVTVYFHPLIDIRPYLLRLEQGEISDSVSSDICKSVHQMILTKVQEHKLSFKEEQP